MKLFSISEFFKKATAAFRRFPFTLSWALLGTALMVYWIEVDNHLFFEDHYRIFLVIILGISWLIGSQFYIEQFTAYKKLWWLKIVVILAVCAFYFLLPADTSQTSDPTPFVKWGIFLLGGHISLLFAPFITVWHPKAYWNYLSNSLVAVARSLLFAGILYLGLVLALLAVQFLFSVDIPERRYLMLFVVCLGIVHTWVYLADFPELIQHNIHMYFHKASAVFVKFILIPLALLYIVILYAYALKIVVNWELPKGWVSYLITALAALLLLIQFIIHPIRIRHESRLIRKFQPLCYWLFLPLLPLLYIAIYKRVHDYGITVARYYLVVLALFITGAVLYLIFSRKQQLRVLPIVFVVLLLGGSFGFWGAFSVSIRSQKYELKELYNAFAKADINPTKTDIAIISKTKNNNSIQSNNDKTTSYNHINNNANNNDNTSNNIQTVVTTSTSDKYNRLKTTTPHDNLTQTTIANHSTSKTISAAQAGRFQDIIQYLYKREAITEIAGAIGYDPTSFANKNSYWEIADYILEREGITPLEANLDTSYRSFLAQYDAALPIENYQWLRSMYLNSETKTCNPKQMLQDYCFVFNSQQTAIRVKKELQQVLELDFQPLKKRLLQRPIRDGSNIPLEELMISSENDSIRIKIYFTELYINFANKDQEQLNSKIQVLLSKKYD